MLKSVFAFVIKATVIWLTLLIASMIGTLTLGLESQAVTDEGPLNAGQAFLIVNAFHALILAVVASRAVLGGWKLGALLALTFFLAQSFLLVIEALYFAGSVNVPLKELLGGMGMSFFAALCVGFVSSLLWRHSSQNEFRPGASPTKIIVSISIVAVLYIVAYFTAGFFIAWAVPDVRAYYGEGLDISLSSLVMFQVFRGAIWALLAFVIVQSLRPGMISAAVIVGATFSILAAAQLLYPNTFMPWSVRLPHLVEIGISNFVFGAIAALVLRKRT